MMSMYGKPLTWEEVADFYDIHHGGRKARTLSLQYVFDWVAKHPDIYLHPDEDTLHKKVAED